MKASPDEQRIIIAAIERERRWTEHPDQKPTKFTCARCKTERKRNRPKMDERAGRLGMNHQCEFHPKTCMTHCWSYPLGTPIGSRIHMRLIRLRKEAEREQRSSETSR